MEEKERLKFALQDISGKQLDYYLEDNSSLDIIADIKALIAEAQCSTESGILKSRIQEVLDNCK